MLKYVNATIRRDIKGFDGLIFNTTTKFCIKF